MRLNETTRGLADRQATAGGAAWKRILSAFAFVALLSLLQLIRQAGAPAIDTMWAEDGRVFLTDALEQNSLLLIFRPLAGYMHLVPRLVAGVAALLPLEAAAVVFAVVPALIVSALALFTYVALADILPSRVVRLAIATMVALLPAATLESANNAANLHFYLVFGAFIALFHDPRSIGATAAGSAFAFIASTSDPRAALLLPLSIWSLLRGSRNRKTIALFFLGGLALQAAVVTASFVFDIDPTTRLSVPRFNESPLEHVPVLYGVRVVSHLFVGDRWIAGAWERLGGWLAIAGLGLALVITTLIVNRKQIRWIGLILLIYSAGYFAFQAMAWGTRELWPYGGGPTGNTRYLLFPQLLFLLAVGLLIARGPGGGRIGRAVAASTLVMVVAIAALHSRVVIVRSAGPRWSEELSRARVRCERGSRRVAIQTSPPWGPEWSVRADCSRIN
jgi:hypothetical protein